MPRTKGVPVLHRVSVSVGPEAVSSSVSNLSMQATGLRTDLLQPLPILACVPDTMESRFTVLSLVAQVLVSAASVVS